MSDKATIGELFDLILELPTEDQQIRELEILSDEMAMMELEYLDDE